MNPNDKILLTKFTMAAKRIIYDAGRMKVFLQMMGTQPGSLHAVQTILAVIGHHKPIPPQIVGQLGVNAYIILVDMAQESTKHKADPKIMHDVIQSILAAGKQAPVQAQPQATPAAPQGVIGQQMAVAP